MTDAPPPPAYSPPQPLSPADEKLWATLIHIGGIFFSFVPALIGYLVLKDRSAFVSQSSKNALNFQITMAIAYIIGYVLIIVVIGILVVLAVAVVVIIFSILAALAAQKSEVYKYPLTINFVK